MNTTYLKELTGIVAMAITLSACADSSSSNGTSNSTPIAINVTSVIWRYPAKNQPDPVCLSPQIQLSLGNNSACGNSNVSKFVALYPAASARGWQNPIALTPAAPVDNGDGTCFFTFSAVGGLQPQTQYQMGIYQSPTSGSDITPDTNTFMTGTGATPCVNPQPFVGTNISGAGGNGNPAASLVPSNGPAFGTQNTDGSYDVKDGQDIVTNAGSVLIQLGMSTFLPLTNSGGNELVSITFNQAISKKTFQNQIALFKIDLSGPSLTPVKLDQSCVDKNGNRAHCIQWGDSSHTWVAINDASQSHWESGSLAAGDYIWVVYRGMISADTGMYLDSGYYHFMHVS